MAFKQKVYDCSKCDSNDRTKGWWESSVSCLVDGEIFKKSGRMYSSKLSNNLCNELFEKLFPKFKHIHVSHSCTEHNKFALVTVMKTSLLQIVLYQNTCHQIFFFVYVQLSISIWEFITHNIKFSIERACEIKEY